MAFIAGASGSMIRDGIFLDRIPIMVEQWQYLAVIVLAAVVTALFVMFIKRFSMVFVVVDALGLGIYGIIAAQMAINADLNILAAIFIGLIGAISGGFLRDIVTNTDPLLLKPSQYYFTAALAGIVIFIALAIYLNINAQIAAIIGISITFLIRMLSVTLNWHTFPVIDMTKRFRNHKHKKS
jgi:uncharacterized membrane protein YeiH